MPMNHFSRVIKCYHAHPLLGANEYGLEDPLQKPIHTKSYIQFCLTSILPLITI